MNSDQQQTHKKLTEEASNRGHVMGHVFDALHMSTVTQFCKKCHAGIQINRDGSAMSKLAAEGNCENGTSELSKKASE